MINIDKLIGDEENSVSPFKDPFVKEGVKAIHIHGYSAGWSSSVEFENGNTEGKQRFESKDFNVLVNSIKAFIETLE